MYPAHHPQISIRPKRVEVEVSATGNIIEHPQILRQYTCSSRPKLAGKYRRSQKATRVECRFGRYGSRAGKPSLALISNYDVDRNSLARPLPLRDRKDITRTASPSTGYNFMVRAVRAYHIYLSRFPLT